MKGRIETDFRVYRRSPHPEFETATIQIQANGEYLSGFACLPVSLRIEYAAH